MKLLVATKETQGQRKNDFNFCNEGEVVMFVIKCDGERIDGSCGCKRSMSGAVTHKATTTMKVIDSPLTRNSVKDIVRNSLQNSGWIQEGEKEDWVERDVSDLLRIAGNFQSG